jgi:hypothetical protein
VRSSSPPPPVDSRDLNDPKVVKAIVDEATRATRAEQKRRRIKRWL